MGCFLCEVCGRCGWHCAIHAHCKQLTFLSLALPPACPPAPLPCPACSKFLVDRSGKVVKRYGSTTTPLAIEADIKALL